MSSPSCTLAARSWPPSGTSYAEVVKTTGRDDHAVQELMEQQHRTMIAAIQRGRFDGPNGGVQVPEGMSPEHPAGARRQGRAAEQEGQGRRDGPAPARKRPGRRDRTPRPDDPRLPRLGRCARRGRGHLSPAPDFTAGKLRPDEAEGRRGLASPAGRRARSSRCASSRRSARASTVFQGKTAADGSCPISLHGAGAPQRQRPLRSSASRSPGRDGRSAVSRSSANEPELRDHASTARASRFPPGASVPVCSSGWASRRRASPWSATATSFRRPTTRDRGSPRETARGRGAGRRRIDAPLVAAPAPQSVILRAPEWAVSSIGRARDS